MPKTNKKIKGSAAAASKTKAAAADASDTTEQPREVVEIKQDQRFDSVFVTEPKIPGNGVISPQGLENIAHHKYQAGDYTVLDNLLNPMWTALVEFLPMTMAPNLVTTIGGCFCLVSYGLSSYYNDLADKADDDSAIPTWLFFWNFFAIATYYTFDCMDGKQARRTGTSSPLGQLFDHGIDSICNFAFIPAIQCIVRLPTSLLLMLQCSTQSAFFQAQWEEYFTGKLPHSTGDYCGVTEVNYGMALWSLVTGIFGREIYNTTVVELSSTSAIAQKLHLDQWLLGPSTDSDVYSVEFRHVASLGWITMIVVLIVASWARVFKALDCDVMKFVGAMEKLAFGPYLLTAIAVVVNMPNQSQQPSSLALGLAFCHITIKMIVYSMAKMAYAAWQFDILAPYVGLSLYLRVMKGASASEEGEDGEAVDNTKWIRGLEILSLLSMIFWIRTATTQLCDKLDVNLFTIKHPQKGTGGVVKPAASNDSSTATAEVSDIDDVVAKKTK
eukprot:CAMPEP_0113458416 /NCGR_PEP_ID=MMETSP0014_2-20120614/9912_1 /TAXON_ID=2857 /ORGANISM="Nitzschia sp." /LENGTH=498 /DNA_ID=CAMNT_0000349941 /DNA_START=141 /DNA_END=1637 /DNA_ORIENTATION=+ /assembly_acc=CAM_ASM_000159